MDDVLARYYRGQPGFREPADQSEIIRRLKAENKSLHSEIERLRSALLGHMQREGQECDKADAWDGAAASFEKGRRAGLEEAAVIAQDQAQMWADHAAKADRASSRYEHRRASAGAGLVAAIIRAKLGAKP